MTEPDLPYIKPATDLAPETTEVISPSPEVKNPLPNHEPTGKEETEAFICPICRRSFSTNADLDLHMAKDHWQLKKA